MLEKSSILALLISYVKYYTSKYPTEANDTTGQRASYLICHSSISTYQDAASFSSFSGIAVSMNTMALWEIPKRPIASSRVNVVSGWMNSLR